MKTIKLASEFKCYPIWHVPNGPEDEFGPIDPHTLPISQNLLDSILRWDEAFQNTYVDAYPPDSGFKDREMAIRFLAEGDKIFESLRNELMGKYYIMRRIYEIDDVV